MIVELAFITVTPGRATLEDHTVGFRASPLFAEWRGHLGSLFAAPPVVEHYAQLTRNTQTGA